MAVKADFSTAVCFFHVVLSKAGYQHHISVLMLLTVAYPATAPASADRRSVTGGREGSEG